MESNMILAVVLGVLGLGLVGAVGILGWVVLRGQARAASTTDDTIGMLLGAVLATAVPDAATPEQADRRRSAMLQDILRKRQQSQAHADQAVKDASAAQAATVPEPSSVHIRQGAV